MAFTFNYSRNESHIFMSIGFKERCLRTTTTYLWRQAKKTYNFIWRTGTVFVSFIFLVIWLRMHKPAKFYYILLIPHGLFISVNTRAFTILIQPEFIIFWRMTKKLISSSKFIGSYTRCFLNRRWNDGFFFGITFTANNLFWSLFTLKL